MSADAELEAIELGSLLMPRVDSHARLLDIPGIIARETDQASPFFNLVGKARLEEANADATIERVVDHFQKAERPVGWVIGPLTTPNDLAERLSTRGFSPLGSATGFVKRNLRIEGMAANVEVREVESDTSGVDEVKSVLFHLPVGMARSLDEQIVNGTGGRAHLYEARIDGRTVGFGQTYFHGDVALLAGAGVLADFRKRGVYRTLLSRRIAAAVRDGAMSVVIQAIGETQTAIAGRFGFDRVCEISLLGWRPTAPAP